MLKKLVKYGNSNALVLDKAILELLNISEGSILKISTDGTSITLTPQEKVVSEKVSETYTNDMAATEALLERAIKGCENVSEDCKKELKRLYHEEKKLKEELYQNVDYFKEFQEVNTKNASKSTQERMLAWKQLEKKYSPELYAVGEKIRLLVDSFQSKVGKVKTFGAKEKKEMEDAFEKLFKKHGASYNGYEAVLNNVDYVHESQLIAEKFQNQKNSKKYLEEMDQLLNKYSPETKVIRDGVKAITEKYSV